MDDLQDLLMDLAFDQQDAEVVCRELDCGAPVQVGVVGPLQAVGSVEGLCRRLRWFSQRLMGDRCCDDSWDIKDAHVVCRQLQCGVWPSSNSTVPVWFGPGSDPYGWIELKC
ncbi:hypothetical protein cypCar_00044578 [Cyprinus carpio]|nr:hypothetical protein cypCar_00044578 [Cyprinus carpio]